jgi:hypothetical protein
VPAEQGQPRVRRRRGELAQHGEVIGQLSAGELEPGCPVGGGELEQRHAALAGVTAAVIGEVGAAPAAQVERLDVGLLEVPRRPSGYRLQE